MSRFQVGRNTIIELRVEDYLILIGALVTAMAIYFSLKSDIEEAMRQPVPDVTREYLDSQNKILQNSLQSTNQDICDVKESVGKIETTLERLDNRIYEMHTQSVNQGYAYESY